MPPPQPRASAAERGKNSTLDTLCASIRRATSLGLKGWFVNQRVVTPRPRVQGLKSRAQRSNERWAMDLTHVPCGADGWGHLTAVIDCNDREITGFEFALLGRAKEAERALEEACLARFGTLRPTGLTLVVRSDNGLIFHPALSRRLPRLPAPPGVHHASHSRTEWNCRTLLSQSQGGVRLAAQLWQLRRSPNCPYLVDSLVQRRMAPSGPRLSQPAAVSR